MKESPKKDVCNFTQIILDNITDGVFTVDKDRKITSFNKAAEAITGISQSEAVGQHCSEVFRANICEKDCTIRETMTTNLPVISKMVNILDNNGAQIPISVSATVLRDENGNMLGGVETFRDLRTIQELRKQIEDKYSFNDIISKNRDMWQIFSTLPQIAESGSTVLLEGESGTGKELFARVIHNLSKRKKHKFIAVNCGALPDTLLESELFGYKAGAFTDAKRDKSGRFAQAKNGTIFLDEIADISPAFQVRLLRFLQDQVYEPLGSTKSETANVRIIAASNKNLAEMVKQGKFRRDLYYRINVFRIDIPPLRKRVDDIPALTKHFISKFNYAQGKIIEGASPDVLDLLMRYNFPGNIRELENIIEHAHVLCTNGSIELDHLPEDLLRFKKSPKLNINPNKALKDIEADYLLKIMEKNNWNRQATAEELNIHKSTLFRKIKRLGITLPQFDGRSQPRESD